MTAPLDAPLRNVVVAPGSGIGDLPAEAIEIVLDRGSLSDWQRIAAEIRRQPWGRVARTVEAIVAWGEHYGVDVIMHRVVDEARADLDASVRAEYAARIRRWRTDAGLTLQEMASLAGTSASRLSAYENGRVAPTTTVLGRLERAARTASTGP